MARKVVVNIIDDFDGESTADEAVLFSLDGIDYEIDLSSENAAALREVYAPWIASARKIRGSTRRKAATATPTRSTADRQESTAAREWARAQGLPISSRGRIPVEVLESYRAVAS
ncbi:histone-like nucleoid-structuring protein Lsr2 [Nocardia sp. NPDC003693]